MWRNQDQISNQVTPVAGLVFTVFTLVVVELLLKVFYGGIIGLKEEKTIYYKGLLVTVSRRRVNSGEEREREWKLWDK